MELHSSVSRQILSQVRPYRLLKGVHPREYVRRFEQACAAAWTPTNSLVTDSCIHSIILNSIMAITRIAVLTLLAAGLALAADPFVGTWKPNPDKWKDSPGAPT